MTPRDPRAAEAYRIFCEAFELEEVERTTFLDEACGDDVALRAEVDELLAAQPQVDLEAIAWGDATPSLVDVFRPATSESGGGLPAGFALGRYTIVRLISQGGMAVVYEAEQDEPKRRVALKLLRELSSAEAARRFRIEAAVLGALDHPGIAKVFEVGQGQLPGGESVRFIAMEFIDGKMLDDHVRLRDLSTEEKVELVAQVCEAIGHAHARGVVHRDLKPANCLVDASGRPKVIDFGIAAVREAELAASVAPTATGEVLGTLVYMAPEQLAGTPSAIGPPTDVHALGMLLYELLSGRRPHDTGVDASTAELLTGARRHDTIPRLRTLVPELPRDIEVIAHAALETEPSRRYPDATAMADDLRRHLRHEPIQARPPSRLYRLGKWSRRHRAPLRAVAVTVALLALSIAAFQGVKTWSDHRLVEARESELEGRLATMQQVMAELRAAGDETAADALFDEFVGNPAQVGSRAVTRAWLDRGSRLLADGEHERAIEALGFAYTSATDDTHRGAALRLIARSQHEQRSPDRLAATLALMERELPDLISDVGDTELQQWRLEAAFAQADVEGARELMGPTDPHRPLLELLAETRPVVPGLSLEPPLLWKLSRDHALVVDEAGSRPAQLPAGLSLGRFVPLELDGSPALVAWDDGAGENVLLELRHGGLVERIRWTGESARAATALTEPDGRVRLFVSSAWVENRFWEVDLQTGDTKTAHPATEAWESYATAMAAMDLDADGRDELVVALGPPEAYDLRVYDTDGPLRLRARLRYSQARDLAPFRCADGRLLVAATTANEVASQEVFPTGDHAGPPIGLQLFALEGNRLRHLLSLFEGGGLNADLWSGDLDGDGLDDLVFAKPGRTVLARQLPERTADGRPRFAVAALSECLPVGLVELKGDPGRKLVVHREGEYRALGASGPPLPRRDGSTLTPRAGLPGPWQRAMDLRDLGYPTVAADTLEHLASFEPEPADRARALDQAARLYEELDDPEGGAPARRRATDLLVAADDANPADAAANRRAIERLLEDGRFEEALSRLDGVTAAGPPEQRAWAQEELDRHARHRDASQQETIDFRGRLDPAWVIDQPLLVQHDLRRSRLDANTFGGVGDLARLPLRRVDDAIALEVRAEPAWLERGAQLRVSLRPRGADEPSLGAQWSGSGWGGFHYHWTAAQVDGHTSLPDKQDLRDVVRGRPTIVTVHSDPEAAATWLAVELPDRQRHVKRELIPLSSDREWELVIHALPVADDIEGAWARVSLSAIRLRGFQIDRAVPRSGTAPGAELRDRLDGRPDDARLRQLLRRPDLRRVAAGALRLAATRRSRPLVAALGDQAFVELLALACSDAAESHLGEPRTLAALVTTPHLVTELAATHEDALRLLVARGRASWLQGDAATAARDLSAAAAHVPRVSGSDACFEVEATLAEIAAAQEDLAAAREHAHAALRCAPAEDLGRDRLLRRPGLVEVVATLEGH
ncbi:MAG: serine/threonine-protein kinase [Acidobacteriota bacterium]